MSAKILPLYPDSGPEQALDGLYLRQRLFELGSADRPFVYANFVSSLDGRIALINPDSGKSHLPDDLSGGNDFRLFQELHAQADCLITHGGYLRALNEGRLGNILQVSGELLDWRRDNGLPAQPDVVVASASLDFPVPETINAHGQRFYIATGQAADPACVRTLRARGFEVIFAGAERAVEGGSLVGALGRLGYRCLYLIAGPRMLETMLRDRRLARLYLTLSHRLLGGEKFHSMIAGAPLGAAGGLRLRGLYYDSGASGGYGQWFAQFDPTAD